jgi:hypothetical protein
MPKLISKPSIIKAAGDVPKMIQEFIGRLNTGTDSISIALMKSPPGWSEPGQIPEFDEYSLVLKGVLKVESKEGPFNAGPGQCASVSRGRWVQYSTPGAEGAEYVSICIPAFSPDAVHRDETGQA